MLAIQHLLPVKRSYNRGRRRATALRLHQLTCFCDAAGIAILIRSCSQQLLFSFSTSYWVIGSLVWLIAESTVLEAVPRMTRKQIATRTFWRLEKYGRERASQLHLCTYGRRDSLDWLFREDWGKEGNQKSYIGSREGEGDLFSSAHERQPAVIYKDPCSSHAQTIILVGCYLG